MKFGLVENTDPQIAFENDRVRIVLAYQRLIVELNHGPDALDQPAWVPVDIKSSKEVEDVITLLVHELVGELKPGFRFSEADPIKEAEDRSALWTADETDPI